MNIDTGTEYPLNDKLAVYAGIFFNNGFAPDIINPNKYRWPMVCLLKMPIPT